MIPTKILVPTDFSDTADHAVDYAFALALTLGAKVHLLHVYDIPGLPDGAAMAATVIDDVQRAAKEGLEAAAQKRRSSPAFGGTVLKMGDARDAIATTAKEIGADLIIMGTHGRRGFQRLLLGSVAEGVLRVASCPVLSVQLPKQKHKEQPASAR